MLELRGVRFRAGDTECRYDLTLKAGEMLLVTGPSGAGKTTLLNLIAGFLFPLSGDIRFNGQALTRLPPQERPVTMLFQEHNLFPHLDALDNAGLGLYPAPAARRRAAARAALEEAGLAGLEKRLPGELSGGQRQRVALARALLRDKPLLLLDEPFAGLDPDSRANMLEALNRLRATRRPAVILVSHAPEDLLSSADFLATVDTGHLRLAQGRLPS